MALLEKIGEDLKAALKSGAKIRLETLRTIRAGLLEKQVEKRPTGGMNTDDEMAVLISASKKRKEAIEIYRQNNRNDLADIEQQELEVIQEYLPKQMSADEVELLVKKIIADTGSGGGRDFGKVMPAAMKELKGKVDGKVVQEIVKRLLGN
jgi:uncharacterized protein YqeY